MDDAQKNPTKLLLHACCGPCSLEPVRALREAGHEPVVYYANSNIHPADEYAHRLETLRAWAVGEHLDVIEGAYDPAAWEETAGRIGEAALDHARKRRDADRAEQASRTAPADGNASETAPAADARDAACAPRALALSLDPARREARCRACYRLRFEEAARYAADHGFTALGTTLSVSPYQYTDVIREELERAAARAGIDALFEDYRPFYDEATHRSRELGMYRQNFCGCRFSDEEAAAERAERKAERRARREAEAAAHAEERAAEEAARAAKRAERQAYAEKQARKRAALKALRESERAQS